MGVRKWFKKAMTRRRSVAKTSQEKGRPWSIVVALERLDFYERGGSTVPGIESEERITH
jgi:hypothetical protein